MTSVPKNLQADATTESTLAVASNSRTVPPVALTIAGFDPSSGAGITADLKTFAAHGVFGVSCPTALTVQSTQGVRRVAPFEATLVGDTLDCLADDIELAGIKIGMLATAPVAEAVADFLDRGRVSKTLIVLDPVLRSSSGATLLDEAGVHVVRQRMLAQVGWITPNLEELAVLTGRSTVTRATVARVSFDLRQLARSLGNDKLRIVVTGGHLDRPDDYFLPAITDSAEGSWLEGELVHTTATHGTGCAFSSALLCLLLQGRAGIGAVTEAKDFVAGALRAGFRVGKGRGPMDHLFRLPVPPRTAHS